ncbi:BTB/POZ domain-containing protein KCTD15-like [Liolophura sinensis]|uniref:BTB/POZ domain-containing protein KCTD15-like n=1 Tax=Liolophura sinensis TaxID=3198878 RepID=UPI0031598E16
MAQDIIHLNVGGCIYMTTKLTLTRYPDSMIGAMFSGAFPTSKDSNGNYFIDRDGSIFRYVLNFLRSSRLSLPADFKDLDLLLTEADFYQIQPLLREVKRLKSEQDRKYLRCGHFIEVIEVRVGSMATIPTKNARVKTVVSGQARVLLSLPTLIIGEEGKEKLLKKSGTEFMELELNGCNTRLQLGEYLHATGWSLDNSKMSSSSGCDTKSLMSNLMIEQSHRDRWFLAVHSATTVTMEAQHGAEPYALSQQNGLHCDIE